MKKNLNQPQENELQYLQLLSKTFPTIADASMEIINLQAILNLPKGTEHFLADIHGAYESFQHVLKNASGNIKRKVNEPVIGNSNSFSAYFHAVVLRLAESSMTRTSILSEAVA